MNDEKLNEERAEPCPWCNKSCMYLEIDTDENEEEIGFRIGAYCDTWSKAAMADKWTIGNDFGRTNWCETYDDAVDAWNYDAIESKKCNHEKYW